VKMAWLAKRLFPGWRHHLRIAEGSAVVARTRARCIELPAGGRGRHRVSGRAGKQATPSLVSRHH